MGPYHIPFCNQSKPYLYFSVWSCYHSGCADLCKVTLLCLWILSSILSLPQGTICGFSASSKFLPLFVLSIFSTSSEGKLWVYICLDRFPGVGLSGSMWSSLWSSIRVCVLIVGMCSFLVLVCRECRWISWTRNHVFHLGLAFPVDMFLVSFWVNQCVFPL